MFSLLISVIDSNEESALLRKGKKRSHVGGVVVFVIYMCQQQVGRVGEFQVQKEKVKRTQN